MKQFMRVSNYDRQAGNKHIKHCLRDEGYYKRDLIPNPRIEILRGGRADVQAILNYVKPADKKGRTGKPLREIMVSEVSREQALQVADLLEKRYNRATTVVYHLDESHPHAHILLHNIDLATHKAIDFSKRELYEINREIAKITGHTKTPAGQGRKRIPCGQYMTNPKQARIIIDKDAQERQNATLGVEAMVGVYKAPISVYSVDLKGGRGRFKISDNVREFSDLDYRTCKSFQIRGQGIYFAPHADEAGNYLASYQDDPRFDKIQADERFTIVRTSGKKYQIHYRLSEPVNPENILKIQRYFTAELQGDAGGHSASHLRRLPGFDNNNYPDKPPVTVLKRSDYVFDVARLLREIEAWELAHRAKTKQIISKMPQSTQSGIRRILSEPDIKSWHDFYEGDRSQADYHYAGHLIGHNLSDVEIKALLLANSEDILARKGVNVDNYITRTIAKAQQYYQPIYARGSVRATPRI